ncbi:MAG: putative Ig domain-containing protein, partial [Acidobacteriota bacterium]
MKRISLLLVVAFLCARAAKATVLVFPSDDEMIIGARAIIIARVLRVDSALDPREDRIFTYITLRISQVIKGHIRDRKITLREEGGLLPDGGSIIFGTPRYAPDEKVLLYLDTWPDGSLRTHQLFLGKFNIIEDEKTGYREVVRSNADGNVIVAEDRSHSRSRATNRMELGAYIEMVRNRTETLRERCESFESENYKDTPLPEPPEYEDRARSGNLLPQFTLYSSSQPARWFEPDSGRPVLFLVNPDGAPNPQILDDIAAAMNAWSSVQGCTMRVFNGGTAAVCSHHGGSNSITFNNCDGRFSPTPECSRIVALGGLRWTTNEQKTVNGTVFNKATAGFISFNPYSACSFSNHCDVREVATHELGHVLGLGHSQFAEATMAASAHFDGRCASLRQDDADGITFIYPEEDGGAGPLAISTPSVMPEGVQGVYYFQVVLARGGSLPYTFSIVPGGGRVPTGLSWTTKGHISGVATEAGTFSFIAQVRDGQGTTVQKNLSITIRPRSPDYDAHFVGQSAPLTVEAGAQFAASLRWLNTGVPTWGSGVRVTSQNPSGNTTWGIDRVSLADYFIQTGQTLDISFVAIAPLTPGAYNFQWQLLREGAGFFGAPTANLRINVVAPPPTVTSPFILEAAQGSAFTHQLTAGNGTPPYTWSIVSGALPPGLNLTGGVISGTPSAAGSFAFTVQVTDSQSRTGQKAITINVAPPALSITTSSLASAMRGVAYNQALSAAGGSPPYTWRMVAGSLPAGLSLANGAISGTPVAEGSFAMTLEAADSQSRAARRDFNLTVVAPSALRLDLVSKADAMIGSAFVYQPSATGGVGPYSWSVTSGSLPSGLSLNPATGAISGSPSQAG